MSTITYRKTSKGEWVAYGPASALTAGAVVTVTKRSGETKTEQIASTGKPFTADGQRMVYGYLAASAPAPVRSSSGPTALQRARTGSFRRSPGPRASAQMCDECGERRAVTTAADLSGIPGQVCGICASSGALSFA